MDANGICEIIKACGEHNVLELHLGELSLFRTQDANYFAFANRNPHKKLPPSWLAPEPQGRQPSGEEAQALTAGEAEYRDDVEANLPLTDPVEYERMQLKELEGQARGLTAEQVAAMEGGDDEENF